VPFVLDNSVVCGWFLADQASSYTEAIAARLEDDEAVAPAIWELEFVNVLRTACLRRKIDAQQAQAIAEQIARLPIQVDRHAVPRSELLGLALRFGLSSCDASYLELALRRMLPLATADDALREAALAAGVGWVAVPSGPATPGAAAAATAAPRRRKSR
jgi:predicted nucleic acid-binding protein